MKLFVLSVIALLWWLVYLWILPLRKLRARWKTEAILLRDGPWSSWPPLPMLIMRIEMLALVVLLLSALILKFGADTAPPQLNNEELDALEDFYIATNGSYWIWNDVQPVKLQLSHHNITGPLGEQLSALTDLEVLELGFNVLTGSLLEGMTSFSSLRVFDLRDNFFFGTVPPSIGNLTQLTELNFSLNLFEGAVPPEFFTSQSLSLFAIASNAFTGPLPSTFCGMPNITLLSLEANFFVGEFPSCVSDLSTLQVINIGFNLFDGTLTSALCNLPNLTSFDSNIGRFDGPIPACLGNVSSLRELILSGNFFNGSIPEELGHNPDLMLLDLSRNLISSTVPAALCNITELQVLNLYGTNVYGTLPSCINQWTKLFVLQLSSCDLEGSAYDSFQGFPKMRDFQIAFNRFTGPLFPNHWPLAEVIDVELNYLSGPLPDLANTTASLTSALYAHNFFTGTLPSSYAQLSNLSHLEVSHNALWGSIPTDLLSLANLDQLGLAANLLTGPIPAINAGSASRLADFNVSLNFLTGDIPPSLAAMSNLVEIDLSNNLLSGSLPATLTQLGRLRVLFLKGNALTGSMEAINFPWVALTDVDLSHNRLTGSLPEMLFSTFSLNSFVAAVNCLEGTLPAGICSAPLLSTLVLDGVTTASSCRQALFPAVPYLNAFVLNHALHGSIPPCLYAMPLLHSLHLSGNHLTGTLPSENYSYALNYLSLSNNLLGGTIPSVLQRLPLLSLDLSYNRFHGHLDASFHTANSSVSLEVNRLSGAIPHVLRDAAQVSILNGNIFECPLDHSTLPRSDPYRNKYSCGSDAVNRSLYILVGLVCACAVFALALLRRWNAIPPDLSDLSHRRATFASDADDRHASVGRQTESDLCTRPSSSSLPPSTSSFSSTTDGPAVRALSPHQPLSQSSLVAKPSLTAHDEAGPHTAFTTRVHAYWRDVRAVLRNHSAYLAEYVCVEKVTLCDCRSEAPVTIVNHPIAQLYTFFSDVRTLSFRLSALALGMLVPTYAVLSRFASTYEYSYAWQLSGVLLEGVAATIVLFVCFTCFLVLFAYLARRLLDDPEEGQGQGEGKEGREGRQRTGRTAWWAALRYGKVLHLAIVALINLAVMVAVDCVYVYVVFDSPSLVVFVVQVGMAVFKVYWNEVCLWLLVPFIKQKLGSDREDTTEEEQEEEEEVSPPEAEAAEPSPSEGLPRPPSRSLSVVLRPHDLRSMSRASSTVLRPVGTIGRYTVYSHALEPLSPAPAPSASIHIDAVAPREAVSRRKELDSVEVPFLAFTTLVNNILVPLAAIASISSTCFNNALVQADAVTDSYPVVLCAVYRGDADKRKLECTESYLATFVVSYDPPFIYTYQCASTLFVNFSAVFVYMLVITGLLLPTAKLVLRFWTWQSERRDWQASETSPSPSPSPAVHSLLPAVLQPVQASSQQTDFQLYFKEKVVVRFVAMLGTLLAFGAVFPPLVLIVGASFCYVTLVDGFLLASVLYQADRRGYLWYRLQLLVDVEGLRPLFYATLWQVMPFAFLSYAYLLFDTLGYTHGWRLAAVPTFLALGGWAALLGGLPTAMRTAENRGAGRAGRRGERPPASVEGHEMLPSTFSQLWLHTHSSYSPELEDSLRVQRGTIVDPPGEAPGEAQPHAAPE